jgi:uncharacterized protein (TIGR02099 family)
MTGYKFSSLLRRRWLWALAGFFFAIPLTVLAWIYWVLLPNLPHYKDDIVSLLSSATGYTITLEKIDGEWGGARPRFTLEGVGISERGRRLLYFSKLEGRFGWRTLIALEPRFHELFVEAPGLTVRRGRDGMIHVGGFKVDPNSPDTSFSDWLLKQGVIRMEGATLAWVDDTRDSPPLVLRNVTFLMQSLLNRHAIQVNLTPPAHLAKPLTLKGVLYGRSLSKLEDWRGKLDLNIPALELAAWQPWLPAAYAQARGHGKLGAGIEIAHGRMSAISAELNLAALYLEAPEFAAPLDLARVTGVIGWTRKQGANIGATQTVYARGLSVGDRGGISAGPLDLSYRWGDGEKQITAAHLSLREMAGVLHALPLEDSLKALAGRLAPRGRVDSLDLTWQGQIDIADKFSVNAHFANLGWAADGIYPGADNLSGMLVGNEEKGTYAIAGKTAGFDLPSLFAEPQLRFDALNIRGGWKREKGKLYTFDIAEAVISNADFAASLYGRFGFGGSGHQLADLTGRVERANGPRIERYLPLAINEDIHAWLRDSVLRGEVRQGTFKLQGDLAKFPFRTAEEGIFRIAGKVHGGQLRFATSYPQIDDIEGELLFDGIRMEIHSDNARIYGAQLRKVKALIPDLETTNELLEVSGEAAGPAQEFIRFVNFSPVNEIIGGLTDEMTATGDILLQLNIKVPLRHNHLTTLAGRLSFDGNTIFPGPDLPRLENVGGALDFTDQSVSIRRMNARILGGPAAMTAVTEGGKVWVRAKGTLMASALDSWLGQGFAGRLSGQADWAGELRMDRETPQLRLESNLFGMGARLPAPMEKAADKARDLVYEMQGLADGSRSSMLQYGNVASMTWISAPTPAGFRLKRGEIIFDGKAQMPSEPGLQIKGSLSHFDLGGWVDILPLALGGEGTELAGIDLSLGSLDLLGRQFHDISVKGRLKGNLMRISVTGQEMAGHLTYRHANDESAARLSVQLKQFILPDSTPSMPISGSSAMRLQEAGFPAVDLAVEDLKFGSRPMGRLEVMARSIPGGMAIDKLNLLHPDSEIRMSGTWKGAGLGETRMKVNAEIKDAGLMLGRFGHANTLRKGLAEIEGEVTWRRSPADFSFDTLDGTLRLKAKNGQFLKVEPGAGKLMGVISLQSLPRRITMDFRDVFSEGFAFDEISSTMQLADGRVYTNDFLMKGPSATVRMSGVAKLKDESVRLRVKVSPKLSESVAVAGALLGGPVAGLGALVLQKALKDPIEEATSFEYLIDGPWSNPAVTKLVKPKPVQEKEPDS